MRLQPRISMDLLLFHLEKYHVLKVQVTSKAQAHNKVIKLFNNSGCLVAYVEMGCWFLQRPLHISSVSELLEESRRTQKRPSIGFDQIAFLEVMKEYRGKGIGRILACLVFLNTPSRGLRFSVVPNAVPFWKKILGSDFDHEVLFYAKKTKLIGNRLLTEIIPPSIWNSRQTRSVSQKR